MNESELRESESTEIWSISPMKIIIYLNLSGQIRCEAYNLPDMFSILDWMYQISGWREHDKCIARMLGN